MLESGLKDKNVGSHETIIKELTNSIKRIEKRDASIYKESMMSMKSLRGTADYSDSEITREDVDRVEALLIKVQTIIKNKYLC